MHPKVFFGLLILAVAAAGCAYPRPPGQWVRIDAAAVDFLGVETAAGATPPASAEVCREARRDIERQLVRLLPRRLAPLAFHDRRGGLPAAANKAALRLLITHCDVDQYQWDAGGGFSISFYLTLRVRVNLEVDGKPWLSHEMETYEQVHTDTPSPLFEFTFREPVDRTLMLFERGRVWISSFD